MKKSWIKYLMDIQSKINEYESNGSDTICFRGQSDSSWNLEPSIFIKLRNNSHSISNICNKENSLFFDFVTNSGQLLDSKLTDWETLFIMRHHGIPTRILDWTENFSNALYFALHEKSTSPTIWMFNPFEINEISYNSPVIPNPLIDIKFSYTDAYIEKVVNPYIDPIVIMPPRTSARLFAQKGLFTLQGSDNTPMNLNPKLKDKIEKFVIPKDAIEDARKFLKLAGTNHYSIYPDLDGLSMHLSELHEVK